MTKTLWKLIEEYKEQKQEIERLNNIMKVDKVDYNFCKTILFSKSSREEIIEAFTFKCEQCEKLYKQRNEESIKVMIRDNIIKEAREYIENNKQYAELEDYEKNGEYYIDEIGLLEILDKVGSDKE